MSQRKSQTCADCARRKIKCDKVIPCSNCTKRGSAHLCRRADPVQSAERHDPSDSLSPGAHDHQSMSRSGVIEAPINEKILHLVNTLSERVQRLEASLLRLEPRKRSAPDEPFFLSDEHHVPPGNSSSPPEPSFRPVKHARTAPPEMSDTLPRREDENGENDSSSGQNVSDAEAEDAATVLEFLAWGRLKDSSITSDLRDPSGAHNSAAFHDKDVLQTAQTWSHSPSAVSGGGYLPVKPSSMAQIQDQLPCKTQVILLSEYHANWLLFIHCSFHVTTFRSELDQFYSQDRGLISMTNTSLQWAALLFAVMCGSMTCAKPPMISSWGFHEEEQRNLANRYFQAAIECLNAGKFQQNHCIYGVQAISTLTLCAHMLGYSNSQSVLLASAVRISQSLGLHRLSRHKKDTNHLDGKGLADAIQKETGRRVWQQLVMQDWFSVPFSETYCVNRLHFSTEAPLHCDDETLQPLPLSTPTITSYSNFLFHIARLMPELLDKASEAQTINTKYEQVLHFDQRMRELVMNQLPSCINGQMPTDPSWPAWVPLSRHCLTITAAHKIIMIHRKFLGMSFHDPRFAFTRRTCLAAAKTIINEAKQELPNESPILWIMQAFSVAAAIILSLDNFNRHQSAREYAEHRQLVSNTISILSASVSVSSIAARGTRLLTDLLQEEQDFHARAAEHKQGDQKAKQRKQNRPRSCVSTDKTLNVSAFVKKFCEADQPPLPGNSPIATSHIPLWLQDSGSTHHSGHKQISEELHQASREGHNYAAPSSRPPQPLSNYNNSDMRYMSMSENRQLDSSANLFGQKFTEKFDIRTVNWFDDLLGLAPSNSI